MLMNQKKRMVIDYSQTVNRYTLLDAYPSPNIDEMVNKIAQYEVFSTVDMRSAYHQMPINTADKQYTAFEAGGKLYQFCRMPFGLTNAVACFQRKMDDFVEQYNLSDTFVYLDNITIAGKGLSPNYGKFFSHLICHLNRLILISNGKKCRFEIAAIIVVKIGK